jgi:hypothetical protein
MGARPDLAQRNRDNATHGMSRTRTFYVWGGMRQRCSNPSDRSYCDYGGRGIRVCDRWADSFENFLADMGEAPKGMQIDRINNDGPYAPDNCRWTTPKRNSRNRRSNVYVEHNGVTRTVAEWAEVTGLERKTLEYRIRSGWPAEKALSTPSITNRKKTNGHFTGIDKQDAA